MHLSDKLKEYGFEIKRLKTGTPQRIDRKSIDFRCGIWDINTHLTTTDERREFVERFGKIAKRLEGSKHQNYCRKDLELILEYTRRQCNLHKSEIEELLIKIRG